MELEGFGVSLVGRTTWVCVDTRTHSSPVVPWEFLQNASFPLRMLVTDRTPDRLRLTEAEADWTCVWTPASSRDWSGIATILRSAAQMGHCLVVFDHVDPPTTFWVYLDSLRNEGRSVTQIWLHTVPPVSQAWVPDALFFPPTPESQSERIRSVFESLPERGGHRRWMYGSDGASWCALVSATHEQGLGLVLTDIEESTWTLLWHRPSDSRKPLEKRVAGCVAWIQTGTYLMGA